MDASRILGLAIELELKTSECYDKLSHIANNESLRDELRKLAKEEIVHANLLKTGRTICRSEPEAFGSSHVRQEEIENHLVRIGGLIDSITTGRISLLDALGEIHAMENEFEQVHLKTLLEIRDPALQKLFRALSAQDHEHRQRLEMIMGA